MQSSPRLYPLAALVASACSALLCRADPNVIVSASANAAYTAQKYEKDIPRRETYVIAQGNFFEGATADSSIDALPFRRILEVLAPELARRQYLPAKAMQDADLLIAVHWGVTQPRASLLELTGRTSPVSDTSRPGDDKSPAGSTDFVGAMATSIVDSRMDALRMDSLEQGTDLLGSDLNTATTATLLGYTKVLRKGENQLAQTEDDRTLRSDLTRERYFIILKAYDLRKPAPAGSQRRAAWSLHLNMSSAGNNFSGALAQMSNAAVDYFGRSTESVDTVRTAPREGRVEVGAPVIVSEKKTARDATDDSR